MSTLKAISLAVLLALNPASVGSTWVTDYVEVIDNGPDLTPTIHVSDDAPTPHFEKSYVR